MSTVSSELQAELLREQMIPAFLAMLDDATALDEPAYLEQLAATLLVPLEQFEMPQQVASAVLDAVEARGDVDAAGLLAALGVLGAEPLSARAQAAAQRLADKGIVSPIAGELGTLAVQDAARIDGPAVELLAALLRRPGAQEVQAALLGIEHYDVGDVLVRCSLTPPGPIAPVHELLSDGVHGVGTPVSITADELTARVLAAAQRAVDAQIPLGHETAPALVIVSRALTGDPTALPRPAVLAPWEDDPQLIDDDEDQDDEDDGFHREMDMLLDEFEQHARATHSPDGVVWQHGSFVASSMLQYKRDYADGRLCHWTGADLAEYLLDHFPRKVSVEEQTLSAVPRCACAFLEFLDARASLSGQPLEQLVQVCHALRGDFLEHARDRSRWGPAKSLVMQMLAEGIDPSAPGAMDAWMANFNARPPEQRKAIVGPATDRMIHAAKRRVAGGNRTRRPPQIRT
jgi:hypothetical protein